MSANHSNPEIQEVIDEILTACENAQTISNIDSAFEKDSIILLNPKQIDREIREAYIFFDVSQFNRDVKSIKALSANFFSPFKIGLIFKITQKNNESKYIFLTNAFEMKGEEWIKKLSQRVPAECIETNYKKARRKKIGARPPNFWDHDNWQHLHTKIMYQRIDKITMEAFEKYLANDNLSNPFIVLDVGGGDGRLAKKLIEILESKKINYQYLFLEPSKSIPTNSPAFKEKPHISFYPVTLEHFFNNEKKFANSCDVIISSGGPLNEQVVSYNEALKNINILKSLLSDNGTIIAVGVTTILLSKKEIEAQGLEVLTTISKSLEDPTEKNLPTQCYVMRKPR